MSKTTIIIYKILLKLQQNKMKKKLLKTFLLAVCLGGANFAWGETIASMGSVDAAWTANKHSYTVAANKTLTLNFTVSSVRGEADNDGYYVDLKQDGSAKMAVESSGGFYFSAAPNGGWWQWGYQESFDCDWWTEASGYSAFLKTVITGATVELTIQRYGTQVTYYADIKTSSSDRHYLRIISPVNTLDEDKDLIVDFGANHAVLTGITDEISDEFTGTLIGRGDNHADYNGTNTTHQDFTLAADKSLTLNFINYSSKIGYGDNWYIRITNGTKYLDLRSDYWGGESDGAGYYYRTVETSSPGYFTLASSTGDYFDEFPTVLHKANVALTVTRVGNVITISAVQDCTSGVVKTQTYTLTHDDFETGDITVGLYAAWSHLDLLPVTAPISSYGWATFSSDYALDFSKATEGLEAYMITGHEGNVVTKAQVTGTVPAGTGLLLKGAKGDYNIPIVGSSSTDVSSNLMVAGTGASVSAEEGSTRYVLGVNNNSTPDDDSDDFAEFQKIVKTAATVAKGKAYLEFVSESLARSMRFEGDDITGVENIEAIAEATLKEGKFIESGKLVIVKNGMKFNAAGQQMK